VSIIVGADLAAKPKDIAAKAAPTSAFQKIASRKNFHRRRNWAAAFFC
jgi:hypothetical protein